MNISFDAIGAQFVTFIAGATAAEGKVCKLGGNGTVTACAAGDDFCGVVSQCRDGAAAVLMHGYCELAYTGTTAPAVGYGNLAADAIGGVQVKAGAKQFLIVSVDTAAKTVDLFL